MEYTAANWVFHQKRQHEEWSKKWFAEREENKGKAYDWTKESPNISMLHTGYGICFDNKLHGDIEYYYEVIHEVDSTQARGFDGKVKAEIHCYRPKDKPWDEPAEIEEKPFAKIIFKEGHGYEIERIEGLDKDFKEPEKVEA